MLSETNGGRGRDSQGGWELVAKELLRQIWIWFLLGKLQNLRFVTFREAGAIGSVGCAGLLPVKALWLQEQVEHLFNCRKLLLGTQYTISTGSVRYHIMHLYTVYGTSFEYRQRDGDQLGKL